jgi:hypothetical protein
MGCFIRKQKHQRRTQSAKVKSDARRGETVFLPLCPEQRRLLTIALKQQNPKQQDSLSYDRYDDYKSAKNLHEFLDAGGSLKDFRHDLKKGFLCLVGNAAVVLSDAATVTRSMLLSCSSHDRSPRARARAKLARDACF